MSREYESPHWTWLAEEIPDLEGALCALPEMDPEVWFIDDPVLEAAAVDICNSCPVQAACLRSAYDEESKTGYYAYGIRGGITGPNRQIVLNIMRMEDFNADGRRV